jgi:hypothetical protein
MGRPGPGHHGGYYAVIRGPLGVGKSTIAL